MSDTELIRRVLAGQGELFGNLVRKYQGKVMGSCRTLLNNQRDAEEAVQDIFVKAYRALDRFKGDSSFSTWLYRIAKNHCLDILRRRARRRTVSLEGLLEKCGEEVQWMLAVPETGSTRVEDRQLIDKILSNLTEEHRIILTLREMEELQYREIAEFLDCSFHAVKRRLTQARRSLKETLGPYCRS